MKAFVTGSQVYGTPTQDSDIDLVVHVESKSFDLIYSIVFDQTNNEIEVDYELDEGEIGHQSMRIKFGKLDLILVSSRKLFNAWKKGTNYLKSRKPVTRAQACHYLTCLRKFIEPMEIERYKLLEHKQL